MKETKAPEIGTAQVVEEKQMVNCPKCSTSLYVKVGNFAYLCPVCSQVFRTRKGEKLMKDISRVTMVEAYVNVDKDDKGNSKKTTVVKRFDK